MEKVEAGTDVGYSSFNKQAADLIGGEGRLWILIHHDGSQSHVLGLGHVCQKSEGNMNWLYELAGERACGSKSFEQKFLRFIDCIVLSHIILPTRHSIECSCRQRDPLVSMVRQIMLVQSFVVILLSASNWSNPACFGRL